MVNLQRRFAQLGFSRFDLVATTTDTPRYLDAIPYTIETFLNKQQSNLWKAFIGVIQQHIYQTAAWSASLTPFRQMVNWSTILAGQGSNVVGSDNSTTSTESAATAAFGNTIKMLASALLVASPLNSGDSSYMLASPAR